MRSVAVLLSGVAAASAYTYHFPASWPAAWKNCSGPYLNDLAVAAGKLWFGTAADIPGTGEASDPDYQKVLNNTKIFGEITPANGMKWMFTQPEQYVFNYTDGEIILQWAESQGKQVRCHNLVWSSELADFVTSGNWTAAQLTDIMRTHIYNVVEYFGDRCYSWDVVNEALNDQNGGFSSNVFYNTIGSEYFYQAFQFANEAKAAHNLKVKLYYNDYNIEAPGTKTTAAYGLVKNLTARGIKIDGVGLESHFVVGSTPSLQDQITAKQGYLALGVEVAITELDVRFPSAPYYNVTGQAQQATDYYNSVKSCVSVGKGCVGTVVWDFDDNYSWVPGTFAGQGGADIYNNTLQRKPAYYAIAEALAGYDCQSCSPSFQTQ